MPPFYFKRVKREQWPQALFSQDFPVWLKQHRPDVVVCHDNHMVKLLEELGYRVPGQIGVVHIATDDDVSDWAGINSRRREIGASAADTVISLLQNRRFGVPKLPLEVRIRGTWHNGRTLLVPKPKNTGSIKVPRSQAPAAIKR